MLFILTGDIQIGKTRWLQQLIGKLEDKGTPAYGVVAPGVWVERADGAAPAAAVTYEKLGIDNELLPAHERIRFARRRDLADAAVSSGACSQAESAQLAWAIEDDAIQRVNDHLHDVFMDTADVESHRRETSSRTAKAAGLLVVDELGRLELLRDEGLTEAMALIDRGATPTLPHALIVVRAQLLDHARERFATAPWGGMLPISPSPEAEQQVLGAWGT